MSTATGRQMTPKQAWILGLASVASFMISLDSQVVTLALSTIRLDLGASLEQLEWTVNAYNLSFAVLLLTGAALGDRLGRRRVFVSGLALFTLASVACAVSPNIGWLITSRAVQGVGAAMVMPLALTQLSAAFPPERRGKALGIWTGVTGLATFTGPFIGGSVTEGLAWEWIFWINIPIGIVTILLVLSRIEETFGPNNRLDIGGLVLITGGTFGLVWGLVRGNIVGWDSGEVLIGLIAGFLLVVAFVFYERRIPAPMLPMRFFRIRAFSSANAANFALFGSLYGTLFFLAQYLQVALHYGPLGAGLRLMPWTGTLMVCAPIAGNLVDRLGERRFMVGGLTLQAIGLAWIALIADADLSYLQLLPPLIIGGAGISMAMPAAQKSVVGAVPLQEIGKASGAINALRFFGGVFGIAILTAVFAGAGSYATAQTFADGFGAAMGVAALLALAGAIAGLWMPGSRKTPPPMAPPVQQPVPAAQTESAKSR